MITEDVAELLESIQALKVADGAQLDFHMTRLLQHYLQCNDVYVEDCICYNSARKKIGKFRKKNEAHYDPSVYYYTEVLEGGE